MAPRFKTGEKKKKKKKAESSFGWFETSVNGGAAVLSILRDAATIAPLPYLRGAAATTLDLIQTAQTIKDSRADFRRLCEDAATLVVVVYESRQRSEDPDGWPGPGLKDPVDNFLRTLNMIAEFSRDQMERTRFIRVMNSVGDGDKIREFRERLAQVMNQFEVSAHLQSYEILRSVKNMMENYKTRLDEQAAGAQGSKEVGSSRPIPSGTWEERKAEEREAREKDPNEIWFETTVNGGAIVLSLLKDAANSAPLPYLRGVAATSLKIIQIAQTFRENRAIFRRLCEDVATLTVVVYQSRQRSEDPHEWPGPGLYNAVDSFLSTLKSIAAFAQARVGMSGPIHDVNSVEDGDKIRAFRDSLAQAMNRFKFSAHLQSYEILRLVKNMMEDYNTRLTEQVAGAQEFKEVESSCYLPVVPPDTTSDGSLENQVLLPEELAAEGAQKAGELAVEQEVRKKEQEAVNEKLQQLQRMLEGPDHKKYLNEQVTTPHESREDVSGPPLPSYSAAYWNEDQQLLWDKVQAKKLAAEEESRAEEWAAEQEARKKEKEATNETLRQIQRILESGPEGSIYLNEQTTMAHESKEDVPSYPLPVSSSDRDCEERLPREEVLAESLAAEAKRKAEEQEARKKEQESIKKQDAMDKKLQQILLILGSGSEPGWSSKPRSDNEGEDTPSEVKMKKKNESNPPQIYLVPYPHHLDTFRFPPHHTKKPPFLRDVGKIGIRGDSSITNTSSDNSHHHATTVNDRTRHTTNYGGYTNYGQHANDNGKIPVNNYGPERMQNVYGHRQYAASSENNNSRNAGMNDRTPSGNMSTSLHPSHSSVDVPCGQNSSYRLDPGDRESSATPQSDLRSVSTPQLTRPDSNLPVINKKAKETGSPGAQSSSRSGAIVHGIEGSKVVLAALERTQSEEDIAFLKPVADNAIAILCTMRQTSEGEVDDEFAFLALDVCGLAFILVNEYYRCRSDHDQILKLECWSNDLADYLRDDVHPFVQKKIARSFLKKRFMRATDDERIQKFREKLRNWMGKLGIQTDSSIHDKVEGIFGEKISTQNAALQNSASNSEPFCAIGDRNNSPLPQIIISDTGDDERSKGPTEVPHPEGRGTKHEGRESWRRSEQEFNLLHLQGTAAPVRPETPSRPTSAASFRSHHPGMNDRTPHASDDVNFGGHFQHGQIFAYRQLDCFSPDDGDFYGRSDPLVFGKETGLPFARPNRPSKDFDHTSLQFLSEYETMSPAMKAYIRKLGIEFNSPRNSIPNSRLGRPRYPPRDPPFDRESTCSHRDSDRNVIDDDDDEDEDEDEEGDDGDISGDGDGQALPPHPTANVCTAPTRRPKAEQLGYYDESLHEELRNLSPEMQRYLQNLMQRRSERDLQDRMVDMELDYDGESSRPPPSGRSSPRTRCAQNPPRRDPPPRGSRGRPPLAQSYRESSDEDESDRELTT